MEQSPVDPNETARISVVIPALNEADRLPATLAAVGDHLRARAGLTPAEIVVVDDGSRDDTAALATAYRPPAGVAVRIARHGENRGKGAAVRTGVAHTSGRWVLLSDADLATPIDQLEVLLTHAAEDRVVIGSRAIERSLVTTRQPLYRDLMGRAFNLMVQLVAVRGVADTQCGFKLLPGDTGRALAAALQTDGFAFDVELLVVARHWGLKVAEVPVHWRHVEASRVQPIRHSLEMLGEIARLALRRVTGRLPPRPVGARGGGRS